MLGQGVHAEGYDRVSMGKVAQGAVLEQLIPQSAVGKKNNHADYQSEMEKKAKQRFPGLSFGKQVDWCGGFA